MSDTALGATDASREEHQDPPVCAQPMEAAFACGDLSPPLCHGCFGSAQEEDPPSFGWTRRYSILHAPSGRASRARSANGLAETDQKGITARS